MGLREGLFVSGVARQEGDKPLYVFALNFTSICLLLERVSGRLQTKQNNKQATGQKTSL